MGVIFTSSSINLPQSTLLALSRNVFIFNLFSSHSTRKFFFLFPQSQKKSSKKDQNYFSRDLLLFFDFFPNEKKSKKRPKTFFSKDLLLFFYFFPNEKKKQKKRSKKCFSKDLLLFFTIIIWKSVQNNINYLWTTN